MPKADIRESEYVAWPAWYVGPDGERDVFEDADQVPEGWKPANGGESEGEAPAEAEAEQGAAPGEPEAGSGDGGSADANHDL